MTHSQIYRSLISILSSKSMDRKALIDTSLHRLCGVNASFDIEVGKVTNIRAQIGEVLNEMEDNGIVTQFNSIYSTASSRPVALRAENCEREILAFLKSGPKTTQEIRRHLENFFGTDKTPSLKDDNILYSLNGQVIKRLLKLKIICFDGDSYSIAPESTARLENINEMLTLKSDFLTRIHSKGGEFFEHYIMTLLEKYMTKNCKTVLENKTMGGSNDGGIDGVMKTVDCFGFQETVMVQAKNRLEQTSETTVRSFYGAVCAAKGSRGIFACTSDFHNSAKVFLDSIDNCVGVNGDTIFKMAIECQYGFKKKKGKYIIDSKLL